MWSDLIGKSFQHKSSPDCAVICPAFGRSLTAGHYYIRNVDRPIIFTRSEATESDGLIDIEVSPLGFITLYTSPLYPDAKAPGILLLHLCHCGRSVLPPLTRIAHIMRAILLASATAATLQGRCAIMETAQPGSFEPLLACFRTAVARTISRVRSCLLPRFEILPSRSLPPLEFALGVIPIQAAKSSPVQKAAGS
ncbi:hypothetical protein QO005_004707 [Rhizobium paknamense]|uniref:Uncharacterized protein n=1 Tax=Rhizobium paknamense TaxID=1206817 RepID=A0ABU0IM89_9HYPH|nr:hypothetical protein [Rhizobium paknamense]